MDIPQLSGTGAGWLVLTDPEAFPLSMLFILRSLFIHSTIKPFNRSFIQPFIHSKYLVDAFYVQVLCDPVPALMEFKVEWDRQALNNHRLTHPLNCPLNYEVEPVLCRCAGHLLVTFPEPHAAFVQPSLHPGGRSLQTTSDGSSVLCHQVGLGQWGAGRRREGGRKMQLGVDSPRSQGVDRVRQGLGCPPCPQVPAQPPSFQVEGCERCRGV